MVIFQRHEFYNNFLESSKANDFDLMSEIFSEELADTMVAYEDKLFSLFTKSDIEYNPLYTLPYEYYVKIVLNNLDNTQFTNGLAYLFVQNNDSINQNSDTSWKDIINNTSEGIKDIAFDIQDNPADKKLLENTIYNSLQVRLNRGVGSRKLKYNDTTFFKYLFIGVLIAGFSYLMWDKFLKKTAQISEAPKSQVEAGTVVTPDVLIPEQSVQPMAQSTQQVQQPIQQQTTQQPIAQQSQPAKS